MNKLHKFMDKVIIIAKFIRHFHKILYRLTFSESIYRLKNLRKIRYDMKSRIISKFLLSFHYK